MGNLRNKGVAFLATVTAATMLVAACGGGGSSPAEVGAGDVGAGQGQAGQPAGQGPLTQGGGGAEPGAATPGAPQQQTTPQQQQAAPQQQQAAPQQQQAAPQQQQQAAQLGATDRGVTASEIRLGAIQMHGMALARVLVTPQAAGNEATMLAINDAGGVHGRKLTYTDCDDGNGDASRAQACMRKLAEDVQIFSLVTGVSWSSGSIQSDMERYFLPIVGSWAYTDIEWRHPLSFPTHMAMVNEARANAHWALNVIKPNTYGLICLTSPEMQRACDNVQEIMDPHAEMVHRVDLDINQTDLSAEVLAFRTQNPDHIIHYVINPATMVKFMVDASQQKYYPPKGISGNHLGAEVLGSLFGEWPVDRYWTNTTFKFWGADFMGTMRRYAPGNEGINHHIVQSGYVAIKILADAAREIGPDLTREKLIAVLNSRAWKTDPDLNQSFLWTKEGRGFQNNHANGREFMYKYTSSDTTSNPDGTPNGFRPDPTQFVITAHGGPSDFPG